MNFNEDSDSEVFDQTSNASELPTFATRTTSSSSSRKSSYDDEGILDKPLDVDIASGCTGEVGPSPSNIPASSSPTLTAIVEWKPENLEEEKEDEKYHLLSVSPQNGSDEKNLEGVRSPHDLEEMYGSTLTVTIDPPKDEGDDDAVMSDYLDGKRDQGERQGLTPEGCSVEDLFWKDCDEKEEICDLYDCLNEVDIEEEDIEPPPPTKIYLLSR